MLVKEANTEVMFTKIVIKINDPFARSKCRSLQNCENCGIVTESESLPNML